MPDQVRPAALPDVGDLLALADKATAPAVGGNRQADWSAPVKLAIVFAVLAILPSLLVMMTSFTRIVIVLSFVRRALSTQSIPPTIALVGLALFLTIFTMAPTLAEMNARAIKPYLDDTMTFSDAVAESNNILKGFMLRQTRGQDLKLFTDLAGMPAPTSADQVPLHVAIPSFAISEFRTAFEMGFLLFVPFLLIDLVIAGVLLSAGMMMLPPVIISLPFKIVLFILVDGWRLLAESLVSSFSGG
jgi:flagellar biosynthetic protein FliP